MNKYKLYFIIIFSFILIQSVNFLYAQSKEKVTFSKSKHLSIFNEFILKAETKLKIKSLKTSPSELQFRIWMYPHIGKNYFLISLDTVNNGWKGKLYFFQYNRNADSFSNIITKDVNPKTNWNNLISKISRYGLFVLPDWETLEIDSDIEVADGATFLIEVVMDNNYRFFTYNNPNEYSSYSFECNCMNKIINLIDEELDLKNEFKKYIDIQNR